MTASLKAQAIHAIFWSFLDRMGQQGIRFVIMMVLARLLAPEQFGLVGMLAIFIEIARTFIDSGFSAALIQKKDATEVDICSVFYFNVFVSLVATGLFYLGAPWVAAFYHQPLLTPLMRVLSLGLVASSLACVHIALLCRHIDFKTQLKVSLVATALSGIVGIVMAARGFGVWSLVAQYVGSNLCSTALLWGLSAWRPKLVFSLASVREMFGFGSRLLAAGLLDTIFENIYLVVIGRLFSAAHLGLYTSAKRVQTLATTNVTDMVMRVTFPVLSRLQDDPVRLKYSVRKAMTMLALVYFPIMVGLALTAKPLVYVLLSAKWAAAIPWLQLLCLAGASYPFQALMINTVNALGRSDLSFRIEVLKKILIVGTIAVTYRWGVVGMIWGQVVVAALGYYANSYYVIRLIRYRLKEQLVDLAPYAATSVLMGLGVYLVHFVPLPGAAVLLLAEILLGMALYAALGYAFGLPAFLEMADILKGRLRPYLLSFVRS